VKQEGKGRRGRSALVSFFLSSFLLSVKGVLTISETGRSHGGGDNLGSLLDLGGHLET
jgi:hypothetical protein